MISPFDLVNLLVYCYGPYNGFESCILCSKSPSASAYLNRRTMPISSKVKLTFVLTLAGPPTWRCLLIKRHLFEFVALCCWHLLSRALHVSRQFTSDLDRLHASRTYLRTRIYRRRPHSRWKVLYQVAGPCAIHLS